MDDQAFYQIVALELQNGSLRTGLWARAIAETGGEGSDARAFYIRLRVAELIQEREALRLRAKLQQQGQRNKDLLNETARREKKKAVTRFVIASLIVIAALVLLLKFVDV